MLKYSSDSEIQFEELSHSDDNMAKSIQELRGNMEREIDELQVKDEVDCSYVDPNNLIQTKITK
jgi:hypothetical protein